ncbi:hypothetical protein HDU97_009022 [Phlyctochytrium planicorne]|nr:hypothetical protein HDU97_009022 [Phlyctochytrium planicorne]
MKRKAEDEVSGQTNGRVQRSKMLASSIPSPPASGDYRRASTASVFLASSEELEPLSPASVQDSSTTPGDSQASSTLALIDVEIEDALKEVGLKNPEGSIEKTSSPSIPKQLSVQDDMGFGIEQAMEVALSDVSGETKVLGETAVGAKGSAKPSVLHDAPFFGLSLPPRSISPPPPSTTSNAALPTDIAIPNVASSDFSLADFINLTTPPPTASTPFKTTTAAATATLGRSATQSFDPDVEQFFNDVMGVPSLPLQQDLLPNSHDLGALLNCNILDNFPLPDPVLPDKLSKKRFAKPSDKKRKMPDHRRAKKKQLDSVALHDLHERPRTHAWTPFHFRALEAIKPMLPANASVNETYLFLLELLDLLHWKKRIAENNPNSAITRNSSSESHNPPLADASVRQKASLARLAPPKSLTLATESSQPPPADITEQVMADVSVPLPPASDRRDDAVFPAQAISSTKKAVAAPISLANQATTTSVEDISPDADSATSFSIEASLKNIDTEEDSLNRASTSSSASQTRSPAPDSTSFPQTSKASKLKNGLATEVLKFICVKAAEALRAKQRQGRPPSVSEGERAPPVLDISNTRKYQTPRSSADMIPTASASGNQNDGTKLTTNVLKALYGQVSTKLGLKTSTAKGKEIISPPSQIPEPQIELSKPIPTMAISSQLSAAEKGMAVNVAQPIPTPSAAPEDPMSMLASLALATAPLQELGAQPNQIPPSPNPQATPSKPPKTRRQRAKTDTSVHNPRSYRILEPTIDIRKDPVTNLFHCPIPTCTAPGAIRRYNMLCHFKTTHLKVKNHLCEVCGQRFAKRFDLQRHMVARHTNALLESVLEKSS